MRGRNGSARVRVLSAADWETIVLRHRLGADDKETLDAFYTANQNGVDISVTWIDGTVYDTLAFSCPPQYSYVDGLTVDAVVTLVRT